MKNYLFILVIFSTISCGEINPSPAEEKDCIDRVIQIDDSLGKLRNHACEKISLSETIDNYTKGLESINYKNCPGSFISAFEDHKEAWLNIKSVTNNYPELRGEMHDLFRQLETGKDSLAFKQFQKAIWDTWTEIEKTGNLKK